MSGFPNLPDIELLRVALAKVDYEADTIEHAQSEIRHAELTIDQARQRHRQALDEVRKLMAAMDCEQPGNTGYENRLLALLRGLSQTAERHGRDHP